MKLLYNLLQLIRVNLKKCNFIALIISSSIWMILSIWVYQGSNAQNDTANIMRIYYGSIGNIIQFILLYLSYGIPMLFTLLYLSHPICEEYYLSRIEKNYYFPLSHVCVVLIIQVVITVSEFLIFYLVTTCFFDDAEYVCHFNYALRLFVQVVYSRFCIGLFLVLFNILNTNITVAFTIITTIILGAIQYLRHYLSYQSLINNLISFSNKILAYKILASLIAFILILFIFSSRDISLQEDTFKNEL